MAARSRRRPNSNRAVGSRKKNRFRSRKCIRPLTPPQQPCSANARNVQYHLLSRDASAFSYGRCKYHLWPQSEDQSRTAQNTRRQTSLRSDRRWFHSRGSQVSISCSQQYTGAADRRIDSALSAANRRQECSLPFVSHLLNYRGDALELVRHRGRVSDRSHVQLLFRTG